MTNWQNQGLGTSLSQHVQADDVQDEAIRSFERGSVEPPYPVAGMLWLCTNPTALTAAGTPAGITEAYLRRTASNTWVFFAATNVATGAQAGVLARNGSVPLAGNLNANTNKITALAAATAAGEAVRFEQVPVLHTSGTYFDAGAKTIRSTVAATDPNDLVRLADVNPVKYPASHYWNTNRDALGGGNPFGAVKIQPQGSTTEYTKTPYTPRQLVVRIVGRLRQESGSGVRVNVGTQVREVFRWNADATGGDPGTPGAQAIDLGVTSPDHSAPNNKLYMVVEWKYPGVPSGNNDAGFFLRFVRASSEANAIASPLTWYNVAAPSTEDAGTIQIQAHFGVGT